MFKTILVAIDGSDHADSALKAACDISTKYDAALYLIHIPQVDTMAIAVGAAAVAIPPSDAELADAGKAVMSRAIAAATEHGCEPTGTKIASGEPAAAVLEYASEITPDLIVMGRRGLGNLAGLVLGSVSQHVTHSAPCACMTVK